MTQRNQVRIIAGKWRSRKVSFADASGLRPTTDRVRETLFNWLMNDVRGRVCLDLFAGSGILALEALSRGAASCVVVDSNTQAIAQIKENANTLEAGELQAYCQDALAFIRAGQQAFDLVFLDPPFSSDVLQKSIDALSDSSCLAKGALIYCEHALDKSINVPETWQNVRKKETKTLSYSLWKLP